MKQNSERSGAAEQMNILNAALIARVEHMNDESRISLAAGMIMLQRPPPRGKQSMCLTPLSGGIEQISITCTTLPPR